MVSSVTGNFTKALSIAAASVFAGSTCYLATITSASENAFIASISPSAPVWIGGREIGSNGNWSWVNGPEISTPMTYTAWASDPSFSSSNLDGASFEGGKWSPASLSTDLPALVEVCVADKYNQCSRTSNCDGVRIDSFSHLFVAAIPFNGHYYTIMSGASSYNAAQQAAAAMTFAGVSGYLANIDTTQEYQFLSWSLRARNAYVSGSDVSGEGKWVYTDGPNTGLLVSFLPWTFGEPDGGASANCLALSSGDGVMDVSCFIANMDYVVEFASKLPRKMYALYWR